MRIVVDQDRCVASGQCVMAAEEVFDQRDEDGVAVLLTPQPADDQLGDVQQAITVCPARAIWLEPDSVA
ncbi:ferredoxin [Kineosporia mesophila]|uniref:Ferredoxin n=1 Tax=Kineosporia mesophila TaxID=566012 RepID=A0ABP7AMT8_9ACTN|nr:ferredoxin [Kineosporia mesophila]MCD5349377.1 ferredoxin [Kineosporia mesophila]